jgi:glycosyltransferase involved in cell wall biosynthesis
MAKVSVIMPAYNVAPFIGAAIESVIAQTMNDWELLIADDASTDNTTSIVQAYSNRDARVRLLQHQVNGGISVARNRALRQATGEFLAILDSDDLWEPNYLAAQLAILSAHPDVAIVTGNGWFLGGRRHGRPARPWPDSRPQPTLPGILADEASLFIMSIMRRGVYDAIGGFDEELRSNEDYLFWVRAAIAGFRFIRNDEPLAHYRRRDDSVSASDVRMLAGALLVYEKIRPLLAGRPVELRIVERQIARFERDRLAAKARDALNAGQVDVAADHLSALYAHSGGAIVKLASVMARWTPRLFSRAYRMRRARQEAAS